MVDLLTHGGLAGAWWWTHGGGRMVDLLTHGGLL